jgi:hypothetical protein
MEGQVKLFDTPWHVLYLGFASQLRRFNSAISIATRKRHAAIPQEHAIALERLELQQRKESRHEYVGGRATSSRSPRGANGVSMLTGPLAASSG